MPKRKTLLRNVFKPESELCAAVKGRLSALREPDIRLIHESQQAHVGDSLDLDAALRSRFPETHRWDYLLSVPGGHMIVGLEPHQARDSEISVVIEKKRNAQNLLHEHFRPGHRVAKWFWVSRSPVAFGKMERARRRLDQAGIRFVGRELTSFE